jgi:dTDP-4-dehydrorhamnose reductase
MTAQKILILGAGGMIASRLAHYLGAERACEVIPLTRADLDILDHAKTKIMLDKLRPNWVINGVAFLNVDRCEREPAASYAVNYQAAADLAEMMKGRTVKLIQFSTDFVFDGTVGGYDENAVTAPLSVYAQHKHMADEFILQSGIPAYILRIASVIGAGAGTRDFIKALLARVAAGDKKISVNAEYEISLSTPRFIAWVIAAFIKKQPAFGIYNCVAGGKTSWHDIASVAFGELGIDIDIVPVPASTYPLVAPRPQKSWLLTDKLEAVLGVVPDWEDVLREQVEDLRGVYLASK